MTNDLELKNNKLILSDNLIKLLNADVKDRINIEYYDIEGQLHPFISKNEGGKVLNKNNTVSFRGKQFAFLATFGTEFKAEETKHGILLRGQNPEYKTYTSVNKVLEDMTIEQIKDTNYIIKF